MRTRSLEAQNLRLQAEVDERIRAEEAVKENEGGKQAAHRKCPVLHSSDRHRGSARLDESRRGLRMMGVEAEERIKGMPYLDAVADGDREQVDQLLQAALQGTPSGV